MMELVKEVNSQVPTYKAIKKLVIRDTEFVKTTTRKIKRYGENLKVD
jgi:long-chain acyl-CoA synthetase